MLIFIVISVPPVAGMLIQNSIPIKETVIMFYCVNESISILRGIQVNLSLFLQGLKDVFAQQR